MEQYVIHVTLHDILVFFFASIRWYISELTTLMFPFSLRTHSSCVARLCCTAPPKLQLHVLQFQASPTRMGGADYWEVPLEFPATPPLIMWYVTITRRILDITDPA